MSEYIDKNKLLKYLEDTVLFSGKSNSPYLKGQVNGARLVVSRIKDYKEDNQDEYGRCSYSNIDFGSQDIDIEISLPRTYKLINIVSDNEFINLWLNNKLTNLGGTDNE